MINPTIPPRLQHPGRSVVDRRKMCCKNEACAHSAPLNLRRFRRRKDEPNSTSESLPSPAAGARISFTGAPPNPGPNCSCSVESAPSAASSTCSTANRFVRVGGSDTHGAGGEKYEISLANLTPRPRCRPSRQLGGRTHAGTVASRASPLCPPQAEPSPASPQAMSARETLGPLPRPCLGRALGGPLSSPCIHTRSP